MENTDDARETGAFWKLFFVPLKHRQNNGCGFLAHNLLSCRLI